MGVQRFAGIGRPGRGALALTAVAGVPCGVSSSTGGVYLAEQLTVRKVDPRTGRLTTPAGNGTTGPPGDGGPATGAEFNFPGGVAADAAGNLMIADTGRIRTVAG